MSSKQTIFMKITTDGDRESNWQSHIPEELALFATIECSSLASRRVTAISANARNISLYAEIVQESVWKNFYFHFFLLSFVSNTAIFNKHSAS
jgi:hypothetical protein